MTTLQVLGPDQSNALSATLEFRPDEGQSGKRRLQVTPPGTDFDGQHTIIGQIVGCILQYPPRR